YYPAPAATTVIPTVPAPATIRSVPLGPTVPSPPTRIPSSTTPVPPAETRPSLGPPPAGSFTPSGGFGTGGSFPSGSNYPPETDPYSGPTITGPTITGSSYRAGSSPSAAGGAIREPGTSGSTLAPGVRLVPDPDAQQREPAPSRAPQLLDPRDKSAASRLDKWAVVPAVWPKPEPDGRLTANSDAGRYYEPVRRFVPAAAEMYDDSGWKSAR
ncbi:MAG TPA: hypothetical protein VFV87_12200, partial [Pirellulaceae bacterium]|nr:hypothetical protein [Pirellulaceae bacterium]